MRNFDRFWSRLFGGGSVKVTKVPGASTLVLHAAWV